MLLNSFISDGDHQAPELMEQTKNVVSSPSNQAMTSLPAADSSSILQATNGTFAARLTTMDFLFAVPRMIYRAGHLALVTVPEQLGIIGRDTTHEAVMNSVAAPAIGDALGTGLMQGVEAAVADTATEAQNTVHEESRTSTMFNSVRNLGGVFSYVTSKWAFSCLTVVGTPR